MLSAIDFNNPLTQTLSRWERAFPSLPHAALEADGDQLLRFGEKLHRKLLQHITHEPIHDERYRILFG